MAILSDNERIEFGNAMERLEQMPEFQIFHEKMQSEMVRRMKSCINTSETPKLEDVRYLQGTYTGIDFYRIFIQKAIKDKNDAITRREKNKA